METRMTLEPRPFDEVSRGETQTILQRQQRNARVIVLPKMENLFNVLIRSSSQDFQSNHGDTHLDKPDFRGGTMGEIDHAPSYMWAAIVYPNNDRSTIGKIRYPDAGSEFQGSVCRGERILVIDLPACGWIPV
jgi:hypothetical protein